MERTKQGMKER